MTKSSHAGFSVLILAALLMAGCSDPADSVAKSSGSAPQPAPASSTAGTPYRLDPDSKIEFVGSKVTGSHNGGFKTFSGALHVADGKVVGSSPIEIDMESTWADNPKLEGHLKSPDFFDVAKYPKASFTATAVEAAGAQHKVTGNLNLHGVTQSITFPADVQVASGKATAKAEFAINRKDFGISYAGKADDLIRDNVVIKLDLKATQ